MNRAIREYVRDLVQGDLVALGLTGFFLLLAGCVAAVWIIDRRWRRRRREEEEARRRGERPKPAPRTKHVDL